MRAARSVIAGSVVVALTLVVAAAAEDKPFPVQITAALDKAQVSPGEEVRLSELIPADVEMDVSTISQKILLIGKYDKELNHLINLDPERYRVSLGAEFEDLPFARAAASSVPFPFNVTTPKTKGFELTFKPKKIGIYMITAEWLLHKDGGRKVSQPVILTVFPPEGVPIKKEWLRE